MKLSEADFVRPCSTALSLCAKLRWSDGHFEQHQQRNEYLKIWLMESRVTTSSVRSYGKINRVSDKVSTGDSVEGRCEHLLRCVYAYPRWITSS